MKGTVKWFNDQKGFGFIAGEDGQDYFVHHTQLPQGDSIRENTPVEFEKVQTEKGTQAQSVTILEDE